MDKSLLDRIYAEISKLRTKYYPVSDDEETGEPMFVCHFCGEIGHFPEDISHTSECAMTLVHWRPPKENHSYFDELAYKSIIHQVASLDRYPRRQVPGYFDWQYFCPFCDREVAIIGTEFHTEDCIVTLARLKLGGNV